MDAWNQSFNAYRAKTGAYPWWVTRIPLAVSLVLLLPVAVAALVAVLAGLLLFVLLLTVWKFLSAFFPAAPAGGAGAAPTADDGRVNVRVIGREE